MYYIINIRPIFRFQSLLEHHMPRKYKKSIGEALQEPLLETLSLKEATAIEPLTVGQAQGIWVKYKGKDKDKKSDSLLEVYYLKIEYQASKEPALKPGLEELILKLRDAKPKDNICDLLRKFMDEKESHSGAELKSKWRWIRCCINETLNFEAQQYNQCQDIDGSTVFKEPDKNLLKKIEGETTKNTFFGQSSKGVTNPTADVLSQSKPTRS